MCDGVCVCCDGVCVCDGVMVCGCVMVWHCVYVCVTVCVCDGVMVCVCVCVQVEIDRRMLDFCVGLDTEFSEIVEGSHLYYPKTKFDLVS